MIMKCDKAQIDNDMKKSIGMSDAFLVITYQIFL